MVNWLDDLPTMPQMPKGDANVPSDDAQIVTRIVWEREFRVEIGSTTRRLLSTCLSFYCFHFNVAISREVFFLLWRIINHCDLLPERRPLLPYHPPTTLSFPQSIRKMMFRKILFVGATLLSSLPLSLAQQGHAEQDIMLGMQGLAQAAKDPALLAQLMKDMQDPEMMKEAQKMMQDPKFQAEMKKLQNDKGFKESLKQTTEMFKDPNAAAAAEAKMEHMMKVGNEQLKMGAAAAMEQAMEAMHNPEVMAEMSAMLKDPSFKQQLENLSKDPSFQTYIEAMQDMMKDPAKKRKFEEMGDSIRASL